MDYRATVYLVRVPRRDGGWIHFRTCDLTEAERLARRFQVDIALADVGPGPAWDADRVGSPALNDARTPLPRQWGRRSTLERSDPADEPH